MRPRLFFCLLFALCLSVAFSQKATIRCTNHFNPDKSVSINADCQIYADYTLKFAFSMLNGYTSRSLRTPNIALAIVNRGNSEAMKLVPDNSMNPVFTYRYQFFPGHSFSKIPDTTFKYLLPASEGSQIKVVSVSSTVSILSQKLGTEFRGTSFTYKNVGDTICACRAGTVYECSDTASLGENTEVAYRNGRNRITIEHRDGTIGNYAITAPIKLLVAPGDEVIPGQPIAVFTKESPRYMLIFSTMYLDEKKLLTENNPEVISYYMYMPIYFYGGENDSSAMLERNKLYTALHPKEIVAAEMTKKEKRKFGY